MPMCVITSIFLNFVQTKVIFLFGFVHVVACGDIFFSFLNGIACGDINSSINQSWI